MEEEHKSGTRQVKINENSNGNKRNSLSSIFSNIHSKAKKKTELDKFKKKKYEKLKQFPGWLKNWNSSFFFLGENYHFEKNIFFRFSGLILRLTISQEKEVVDAKIFVFLKRITYKIFWFQFSQNFWFKNSRKKKKNWNSKSFSRIFLSVYVYMRATEINFRARDKSDRAPIKKVYHFCFITKNHKIPWIGLFSMRGPW